MSIPYAAYGENSAHIPSETITYTHLGIFANTPATAMKLLEKVYIVGAHALGTDNAKSTVKNLPKPPRGDRTASIRPPTLLPLSKPASQEGTAIAEAAKTAPR